MVTDASNLPAITLSGYRHEEGKRGPLCVDSEQKPNYELVYDMIVGIKHAVVEGYARRAQREEALELDYKTDLIVLLPTDFSVVNRFTFSAYFFFFFSICTKKLFFKL